VNIRRVEEGVYEIEVGGEEGWVPFDGVALRIQKDPPHPRKKTPAEQVEAYYKAKAEYEKSVWAKMRKARYEKSRAGRERKRRYDASAAGRERTARYEASERRAEGQAAWERAARAERGERAAAECGGTPRDPGTSGARSGERQAACPSPG
jgi:hypothetical protein